jgi:hypothetical protein
MKNWIGSLLGLIALGLSACLYSSARLDGVATIRPSNDGKYRYEIQLTAHVAAHGNPHLQTHTVTHYDDDMWVYTNERNGIIDAKGMYMTVVRNRTELPSGLKGYLKIEGNKLTVAVQTVMYGDGRKGDGFVALPFNGTYQLRE